MTTKTETKTAAPKPTIESLAARLDALEEKVSKIRTRDRGPKSTRTMTDQDAFDVKFGQFAKLGHKAAAEATGLSYGQVYSARGGYTFTHIESDWKSAEATS